jgi:hypothetical protein
VEPFFLGQIPLRSVKDHFIREGNGLSFKNLLDSRNSNYLEKKPGHRKKM